MQCNKVNGYLLTGCQCIWLREHGGTGRRQDKLGRFLERHQLIISTTVQDNGPTLSHASLEFEIRGCSRSFSRRKRGHRNLMFGILVFGCGVCAWFTTTLLEKAYTFPRTLGSYSVVVFTDPVQGKIPISALFRTAI